MPAALRVNDLRRGPPETMFGSAVPRIAVTSARCGDARYSGLHVSR